MLKPAIYYKWDIKTPEKDFKFVEYSYGMPLWAVNAKNEIFHFGKLCKNLYIIFKCCMFNTYTVTLKNIRVLFVLYVNFDNQDFHRKILI